jgi:hypothetical protein
MRLFIFALLISCLTASVVNADPAGGIVRGSGVLAPHRDNSWDMRLHNNEMTRIVVRGDENSDLDCELYNNDGVLVGRDIDDTDSCLIDIIPIYNRPQVFTLRIINSGEYYDRYTWRAF